MVPPKRKRLDDLKQQRQDRTRRELPGRGAFLCLLLGFLALLPLSAANAQTFRFTPGHYYGTRDDTLVSYDSAGHPLGSLKLPGVKGMRGLAFGPDGFLYVVSVKDRGFEVRAVDGDGKVRQTYAHGSWIAGNLGCGKIVFDRRGNFYVGTFGGAVRFQVGRPQSGTIVPHTDGPFGVYDLAILPSGNLLVADRYHLVELSADGSPVRPFATLTDIRGVVYDRATNQVFAMEFGNTGTGYFRLLRYDLATGKLLSATNFTYGNTLVLTADGRLVVGSFQQAPGIFDKNLTSHSSFTGEATAFVTQFTPYTLEGLPAQPGSLCYGSRESLLCPKLGRNSTSSNNCVL